jgi:multidrug efflux pump subunit AcrB
LGPPVEWPIQYRVSGADLTQVRRLSEQVAERIRQHPQARLVNFNWNELSKSVQIEIDQDQARRLGVTSEQIASVLNSAMSGRTITQLREDTYLIDVRGRAEGSERTDLQSLRDLAIGTPKGSVPLAQLATFRYGLEESTIWRRDRLPTITVQADVAKGVRADTVIGQLAGSIDEIRAQLPPGYRLEIGGLASESAKGQGSILAIVPVMLIVMLFILMIQLHSTQKLLLVMLTAPLGLIGVAVALLASNRPFGFVALLGVFALTGMIIRNSVVLMAQIKEHEDEGMERGAAIIDATMHRLRPILLTAAAAILGLIPIASEVFWGPMAFAMMGGLLIATILTLLFLPALYAAWYRVPRPADADTGLPATVLQSPG